MRSVVFADVHSNFQAFEAVSEVWDRLEVDQYFFVGDIVGYGADPKACLSKLDSLGALCVAGNHDRAVSGFLSCENFNLLARKAVDWTQKQLSQSEKDALARLPLTADRDGCFFVHGTLDNPQAFEYLTNQRMAERSFEFLAGEVCFVAHSHIPGYFVKENETISYSSSRRFILKKNARYIVDCGSVGQPRDADPRACFCLFDSARGELDFFRVEYDVSAAAKRISESGLPEALAVRLSQGR